LTGWSLDREPFPLETSLPGIFCAGDVRHGSIKRVASFCPKTPFSKKSGWTTPEIFKDFERF
jgi:hypothetical protein